MTTITPFVWLTEDIEEAGAFYAAALPRARAEVTARYASAGLPAFQEELAGEALTVDVHLAGGPGGDDDRITLLRGVGGPRPTPALSFMLGFDDQDDGARDELDATWAALLDGGHALMPLQEYPFSPHYGWVEDRYGVSWQLMLRAAGAEPRPRLVPDLLFGGPAQNRAHEALVAYTALFDGTVGTLQTYDAPPVPTGPTVPGESVLYADVRLADRWLALMDSGAEQDFTFTPGVSLQVVCDDQAEVDKLWDALSAVPDAEACGWCVDRFGVSWQIVPAGADRLIADHPAAYDAMLLMKKIVLADLQAAAAGGPTDA